MDSIGVDTIQATKCLVLKLKKKKTFFGGFSRAYIKSPGSTPFSFSAFRLSVSATKIG